MRYDHQNNILWIILLFFIISCKTETEPKASTAEGSDTTTTLTKFWDTMRVIKPDTNYLSTTPKKISEVLGKLDLYDNPQDTSDATNRTRLRNLGFCNCMNTIYPDFEKAFPDGSGNGYFMLSNYGLEIMNISRLLAKDFIEKRGLYQSYNPKNKLGIMLCLDYYNSQELDHFIQNWEKYYIEGWTD